MPFMTSPKGVEERRQSEGMNVGKYDILRPIYRPVWAEKGTQLKDFCTKNIIDFITGARPIDEYEAFVEEAMNKYGGNEIMEEAEEGFRKLKGD